MIVEKTGPYNLLFLFSFGIDNTKAMGLLRELCNFRRDYDRNLEIKEAIPSLYKKDPSFYDGMRLQELAQGIHKLIVEHDLPNMMFHAFETLPKMVMTPFDAFQRELNGEVEEVRIQDMQDKVNANMILPYPPGVPLVMPGECSRPTTARCWTSCSCSAKSASTSRASKPISTVPIVSRTVPTPSRF